MPGTRAAAGPQAGPQGERGRLVPGGPWHPPRRACFLSIRSDQKYHQELNIPMICFCTSRSRDMASLRT